MSMTQILNMILVALRNAVKGIHAKRVKVTPKANEYAITVNSVHILLTPIALRIRKGSMVHSVTLTKLEALTPEILAMDFWCLLAGIITPKEFAACI